MQLEEAYRQLNQAITNNPGNLPVPGKPAPSPLHEILRKSPGKAKSSSPPNSVPKTVPGIAVDNRIGSPAFLVTNVSLVGKSRSPPGGGGGGGLPSSQLSLTHPGPVSDPCPPPLPNSPPQRLQFSSPQQGRGRGRGRGVGITSPPSSQQAGRVAGTSSSLPAARVAATSSSQPAGRVAATLSSQPAVGTSATSSSQPAVGTSATSSSQSAGGAGATSSYQPAVGTSATSSSQLAGVTGALSSTLPLRLTAPARMVSRYRQCIFCQCIFVSVFLSMYFCQCIFVSVFLSMYFHNRSSHIILYTAY